ncbi:MAG: methyltransferase domain-containing protein [Thermomicrobiales bacterium]
MSKAGQSELKRVAAIYDQQAPTWDRQVGLTERLLVGSALRRQLGQQLHGDVLEIGTGTGSTLPYLHFGPDAVHTFIGTDLSRGMLQQVDRSQGSMHLAQMSADTLAFPDNTFNVVTCSLVLCTVPDPGAAMLEMARVCKPDGRLVLLEHVRARNPALAWLQRKLTPGQHERLGCHLDRETGQLLKDLGFRIEAEQRRFFGIFVLITAKPDRYDEFGA